MADSPVSFFYPKRLPIRKLPVELEARPFAVGIVTLKCRMFSSLRSCSWMKHATWEAK